jgi:hypothetical protein
MEIFSPRAFISCKTWVVTFFSSFLCMLIAVDLLLLFDGNSA